MVTELIPALLRGDSVKWSLVSTLGEREQVKMTSAVSSVCELSRVRFLCSGLETELKIPESMDEVLMLECGGGIGIGECPELLVVLDMSGDGEDCLRRLFHFRVKREGERLRTQ